MNSYQMVLHRPVETAQVSGNFTQRRDSGAEVADNSYTSHLYEMPTLRPSRKSPLGVRL
jgi:hypothetical protein